MTPYNFEIDVDEYCEHCGSFFPLAESIDITAIGDEFPRYIHKITCSERDKCKAISDFHKRIQKQNDRKEEPFG